MTRFGIILTSAVVMLALSAAVAHAAPEPQTLSASDFNGVWAPEMRRPGGLAGPGDGPGFGPPPGGRFSFPGGAGGPKAPVTISAEDQAKGLDQGDVRTRSQMTDAGKAKFATFDPLEHPASNCRTPGLPSIAMIPELQQWTLASDRLTIRHESFATVRNVRLDQTTHPDETHSALGHAYGQLVGVTVTIDTGNLNAEWGGLGRNAPGSDQRTIRETYRLVDKDTIEGFIEVNDPLYLAHPLRMPVTLRRQPPGAEIVDFPCDVEVSRRDYQYIKDGVAKR